MCVCTHFCYIIAPPSKNKSSTDIFAAFVSLHAEMEIRCLVVRVCGNVILIHE